MIRIEGVKSAVGESVDFDLKAAAILGIKRNSVIRTVILRRGLDCRKKSDIHYVYTLGVFVAGDEQRIARTRLNRGVKVCKEPYCSISDYIARNKISCAKLSDPVIVGSGPAGLFCALTLCRLGLRPVVIERGSEVGRRVAEADRFFKGGDLNRECNIQFGEGGAGTFSDGKLSSGVGGDLAQTVIAEFALHGAGDEIAFESKPHIGTDVLPEVIKNIRNDILAAGGKVLFDTRVTDIKVRGGALCGVEIQGAHSGIIECDNAVFAIGHSARDTYEKLFGHGVLMTPKPFAIGVRIEHLQSDINRAQYGFEADDLPAADYRFATKIGDRNCYTFCMCPGGEVVAAASEEGRSVVNGMSNRARDGVNANSALLVNVTQADYGDNPLDGVAFQRRYEEAAYAAARGYSPVVQRLEDFRAGRISAGFGRVSPSCARGYALGDIRACLPGFVCDTIAAATDVFASGIAVFNHPDSVLSGVETRSSAPLRIVRNERGESSIRGLYPCGEGAGYAGGITSAAADGIRTALRMCGITVQ